jgi:beta-ribofuranosylaminobenzene 5'-phosphate synthase
MPLTINLPFRVHMNLHAMHDCELRKNGGIGFGVNSSCKLTINKSAKTKITVLGECSDLNKIIAIEKKISNIKNAHSLDYHANISIDGNLNFHSGLGIGTALTLASIEGLFLLNDKSITSQKIIDLSERGATSGIGIHTYFEGGMIVDVGVKQDSKPHKPSSAQKTIYKAVKLLRAPLPNWNCAFVIPNYSDKTFGGNEVDFFKINTPIPHEDAHHATYLSLMGVIPSILEKNYNYFKESVAAIQKTKWKCLEISNSDYRTPHLIDIGKKLNLACGMSSLGSGVYFISDKPLTSLYKELQNSEYSILDLQLSNVGRVINYV